MRYVPLRSGPALQRTVSAGALDMGTAGLLSLTQAVARGGAAKAVTDIGVVEEWFFWVLPANPIRKPQDLKEAKISVTRVGSITKALARSVVRSLGLEKDVQIIAAGSGPARIAVLKSGVVQATVGTFLGTMVPCSQGRGVAVG